MSTEDNYEAILEGCRSGKILVVAACLIEAGKNKDDLIKKKFTSCDGEIYSPFLAAVRNGHARLVNLLLEKFEVKPGDHFGTLNFDGYLIEHVSPLWCAAACGNLPIVKSLLEFGAEVNETTSSNSTPLRAACFHGNLAVVTHLMENGADPNITNKYKNTCLMVSSYCGNLEVVEYLLKQNIDFDKQASCGGTALHFACESNRLACVKALVSAGCSINIKNKSNLTAGMVAADSCRTDVIEYFTKLDGVNTETQIMLLELLGTSFANDKECYDLNKTYHYLFLALLLRQKEHIEKEVMPPVSAYNNRRECQTIGELQKIADKQDAIHMEALIVRERILGVTCPELVHPIVYRGAVYADGLQFNRCIGLWKRSLQLRQLNERAAHNDLLRFAEVFSQMILLGERIDTADLLIVVESCITELKRAQRDIDIRKQVVAAMKTPSPEKELTPQDLCKKFELQEKCEHCGLIKEIEEVEASVSSAWNRIKVNLSTFLYLTTIVCKVTSNPDDLHQFGKLIYRYLKNEIRDDKGNSLLHMAVSSNTHVDDFHVKDVCQFPNADTAKFLLDCGANPNARNLKGNTPLHIIVQYDKPISDFITLHRIIMHLLNQGAHYDVSNGERKTPLELSTTGVAEVIVKTQTQVTLKCLAARAIRNHSIPYSGKVPSFLNEFIDMH
uniref:Protein fem-1 homolog B n=1 Tax=Phallusia mammillata TaxID=59560 RepID=A0A6F9DDL6_9ASCI|nr:protein fem-1 homolog B-like [Phallusia mammillata]